MLHRVVGCLALLIAAPAAAAPRTISLAEARQLALRSNPTLGGVERVLAEATHARDAHDAALDTQLAIDGAVRAERSEPRRTPFAQPLSRDTSTIGAALTRVFRHGGEARFGVSLARELATTRVVAQLGHEDVTQPSVLPRMELALRQPLWGGRRTHAAIEASLNGSRDAAGLDVAALRAATWRDVTRAYWQLYLARREVAIRRDARVAAEVQLRQVEAEIARGSRPRLAAIEIEDGLARLREDELIAVGAVGERSLDLSRTLGISPTTELVPSDTPVDLATATEGSLEQAPRLVAARTRIEAARAEVVRADDEARWRVDVVASGSLAAPRDSISRALDDAASYGGWTIELGLTVRGPLAERGPRARRGGARARLEAAELASREVQSELAAELARLRNRRTVAGQRRLALVRAVELAGHNLRAERARWERGDTTAFEWLRRQATLAETQLRLERARVDELEADAALAALFGLLRS